jgi:hypothetical protein
MVRFVAMMLTVNIPAMIQLLGWSRGQASSPATDPRPAAVQSD